MKITSVKTYPIHLTVRPEYYIVTSIGAHASSAYVIVALETDTGLTGWGEATVTPRWSGETQGSALTLIAHYLKKVLIGCDPTEFTKIIPQIDAVAWENNFTKAAVEMALLDLAGKALNKPVYELLGGAQNPLQVPIKFSIGLRSPEETAAIAAEKVADGLTAIKVKVGPDAKTDLQRVAAVREAIGPNVRLNIDVNGGWTVDQAIQEIPQYERFNLEYIEQPTPRHDIDGLAKVRAVTGAKIMADEAVFSVWQAEQVIAKRAADLISIYPGKNGGILKAQQICKLAEAAGIGCHLGSNLEWDIATAAMCHVAAACSNVQVNQFPGDILGPLYYAVHPQQKPIQYLGGSVSVPSGPGLGVELNPEELAALAHDH